MSWLEDNLGITPETLFATAVGGIDAGLQVYGQQQANQANREIARENREWQERMSNTAHQREVADLRKAGLNPILSVNRTGATTPGGNVATLQSTTKDLREVNLKKLLLKEQLDQIRADSYMKNRLGDKAYSEKLVANATEDLVKLQQKLVTEQTNAQDISNTVNQIEADIVKELGAGSAQANTAIKIITMLKSLLGKGAR
jgi:hypothetical protein